MLKWFLTLHNLILSYFHHFSRWLERLPVTSRKRWDFLQREPEVVSPLKSFDVWPISWSWMPPGSWNRLNPRLRWKRLTRRKRFRPESVERLLWPQHLRRRFQFSPFVKKLFCVSLIRYIRNILASIKDTNVSGVGSLLRRQDGQRDIFADIQQHFSYRKHNLTPPHPLP